MDYKECIETVKTARFGSEAREPAADAVGLIPQLFKDHAEKLPEVIQARGVHERLAKRLDSIDETVGSTAPLINDLKERLPKVQAALKKIWEAGE